MRKNTTSRGDEDYPWDWLLMRALSLGVSSEDFWRMSPRALLTLMRSAQRAAAPAQSEPTRLSYIPRP